MGVAVFDYAAWALRFPALAANVAEPLAALYFVEAGQYLDNTDASLVEDVPTRLMLLNLIVAHIAACNGGTDAGKAGLVGRISNVTEGSVTIGTELKGFMGDQAAYFAQTPYGAQYWAMTAQYRTARYVPGPQPYLGVPGYGGARWPR